MAMACFLSLGGLSWANAGAGSGDLSNSGGAALPSRVSMISSPVLSSGNELSREAMAVAFPAAANANVMWYNKPVNAYITVNPGESPESVVRRFKREVMSAGVLAECRRRRFFENAQDVKKRKAQILRRRKINRKTRAASERKSSPPDPFAPKKAAAAGDDDDDDKDFWGDENDEIIFS